MQVGGMCSLFHFCTGKKRRAAIAWAGRLAEDLRVIMQEILCLSSTLCQGPGRIAPMSLQRSEASAQLSLNHAPESSGFSNHPGHCIMKRH